MARHNSATNAQSPSPPPAQPPPANYLYTDHSILAGALAAGLSTVNGAILAARIEQLFVNPDSLSPAHFPRIFAELWTISPINPLELRRLAILKDSSSNL